MAQSVNGGSWPGGAVRSTRVCPTQPGDLRALIMHQIAPSLCLRRQRENYHKCHRCLYRGQPADYVVPVEVPPAESKRGPAASRLVIGATPDSGPTARSG